MMKKRKDYLLSLIMIAAIVMIFVQGCGRKENDTGKYNSLKTFSFTVMDREGNTETFDITTDKATVGEALADNKLIEGDEGEFGLYVKKVNGIEAVYEKDGTYWSFYIDDEYASTGVDMTPVENGRKYAFRVEGY